MTSAACSHSPRDLLLALNGVEERLQLVLGTMAEDGPQLLASRQWTVPGQSVRFLIPGLHETLAGFGVDVSAIARIACVVGPGSFTGLRLVLAAAEGLAAGTGQPLAGLPYLPILAAGAAPLLSGTLHVITYARRGLVYLQSFSAPDAAPLSEPDVVPVDGLPALLAGFHGPATVMGTGLRKNPELGETLARELPELGQLPATWDNPDPDLLLAVAAKAEFSDNPLVPLYLRPSDAEDNLPQIAAKRGMDPEEAQRRLDELRRS